LNEKHIPATNVFFDLAIVLAVGKFSQRDLPQPQVQKSADIIGKLRIRLATEDLQFAHE
jgi:hypothetical protein